MKVLKILKNAILLPSGEYTTFAMYAQQAEIFEAISEIEVLQRRVEGLEAQLSSNPLQLTCEGCKYYDATMYVEYCDGCKRNENIIDFYTKDTK